VLADVCWQVLAGVCWQVLAGVCWQVLAGVCWQLNNVYQLYEFISCHHKILIQSLNSGNTHFISTLIFILTDKGFWQMLHR